MRAMPSPTSRTVPVSRASMPARAPSISREITETISSTLNAMAAPLDELVADLAQAGADAGVVDPVVDADDQAPEDGRVYRLLEDRHEVPHGADVGPQPVALGVGQ